jgi:hypothetical protein
VIEASLAYQPVLRIDRGSWDLFGWKRVGKGVDPLDNHAAQEGALGDLD